MKIQLDEKAKSTNSQQKKTNTKSKRGIKKCPSCGTSNGARAFSCKSCDHDFPTKKKRKVRRLPIENWQEIEPDSLVRILNGSGPYYIDSNGDRHYFSEAGIYRVVGLDENGLHCYSEKGGGYSFIYMGPEQRSKLANCVYRSPHKLMTVNRKNV